MIHDTEDVSSLIISCRLWAWNQMERKLRETTKKKKKIKNKDSQKEKAFLKQTHATEPLTFCADKPQSQVLSP